MVASPQPQLGKAPGPYSSPSPPRCRRSPFATGSAPRAPFRQQRFERHNQQAERRNNIGTGWDTPNERLQSQTSVLDVKRQAKYESTIARVLHDRDSFNKSSRTVFKQFDKDGNGVLEFTEIRALVSTLSRKLQLPPVEDELLYTAFQAFDVDHDNHLRFDEFQAMYWNLLQSIKSKFYPTRVVKVNRSCFIGRLKLASGQTIQESFKFLKHLGSGSFGEVFLVQDRMSQLTRVCKIINNSQSKVSGDDIENEIEILKRLDHPNIIKVFDVIQDYNSIYIIMEYCSGGELSDRLDRANQKGCILTEMYVAKLMRQLLEAIAYFHRHLVAHKDIKPENILLAHDGPNSPIKIIDFGLSEIFEPQSVFSWNAAGTYLYMAPEVLDCVVTLACDIWSAGCVIFQLLTGECPFPGQTVEEVTYKIRFLDPPFHILAKLPISVSATDLLKRMLEKDVRKRATAAECLAHPWLSSEKHSIKELPPWIYDNLKLCRRRSQLHSVLTNMLVHQFNITGSTVQQVSALFCALDENGDGTLSKQELAKGLAQVGFQPHEVTLLVKAMDIDGSDFISYTEFLSACYSWREVGINVIWTVFSKLDKDGDGRITAQELKQCLLGSQRRSNLLDDDSTAQLMNLADSNKDGVIDWDEFLAFVRGE